MPFKPTQSMTAASSFTPVVMEEDFVADDTLKTNRDTLDVVGGFLQNESVLLNGAEVFADRYIKPEDADPNFDIFDTMVGTEYEDYLTDAITRGINTEDDWLKYRQKIVRRQTNDQTFADATLTQKALAIGAYAVSDPSAILPAFNALRVLKSGSTALKAGVTTAAVGATAEGAREMVIHSNDPTRTATESMYNIALNSAISGLLGAAAAAVSNTELKKATQALDADIKSTLDVGTGGSVGAATASATFEDLEVAGITAFKEASKRLPSFSNGPVWNSAISPNVETRRAMAELANISVARVQNLKGEADQSVELRIQDAKDTAERKVTLALNDSYKAYKKRLKGTGEKPLSIDDFDAQVDRAARSGDGPIKEANDAAKVFVEQFNDYLEQLKEVGIFDGEIDFTRRTAKNYVPRRWMSETIRKNETEFRSWLKPRLQSRGEQAIQEIEELKRLGEEASGRLLRFAEIAQDPAELDQAVSDLIGKMLNRTNTRLPLDIDLSAGSAKNLKSLTLDFISDQEADQWISHNIRETFGRYMHTVVPDIELTRRFGTADLQGSKLLNKIDEANEASRTKLIKEIDKLNKDGSKEALAEAKKKQKELKDIDRWAKADKKNIEGVWDRLRGTYKAYDDVAGPVAQLERFGLGYNFARLLGGVTISSMPDIARPVTVHGLNRVFGDLVGGFLTNQKALKLSLEDQKELNAAVDLVNSRTILSRMGLDPDFNTAGTALDKATDKMTQAGALLSGINHWNAALKTLTGVVSQNRMIKSMEDLEAGKKIGQNEELFLRKAGIDKQMQKRILAQFKKYGETFKGTRVANVKLWDDAEALATYRRAHTKVRDEIIVNPGQEVPLFFDRGMWKSIMQFKRFGVASAQRVTLSGIQQGDANYVLGTLLQVMLGAWVNITKIQMSGKEPSDDPLTLIIQGFDRAGVVGQFFDYNNILEKISGGTLGVAPMLGTEPSSRLMNQNAMGALLGPNFGLASSLLGLTSNAASGNLTESDARTMRYMMPYNKVPYLQGIFDQIEGSMASAITE
jgi:hypothetical protein